MESTPFQTDRHLPSRMRVLYLTQEYAPLIAEGGLGLTSRALPAAIQNRHGVEHVLVMPYYARHMAARGARSTQIGELPAVTIGNRTCGATLHRLVDNPGPCDVVLVRADEWYDRDGVYRDEHYVEHADAVERAAFFGWCVATWLRQSGEKFDIVHANDWQSGAALAHVSRGRSGAEPRLLMNVHSGAYCGEVRPADLLRLGLHPSDILDLVRDGEPSLLLLGLLAADAAVTCSPTYAQELVSAFAGRPIGRRLKEIGTTGIILGVDPEVWSPTAVGRSTEPYDTTTAVAGKSANKRQLQQRCGLTEDPRVPVFGVCTRLVGVKGSDLLAEVFRNLAGPHTAQLVVMGPAEGPLRTEFIDLARDKRGAVHYATEFDQELAWLIYAGSDFTVMPSRVEPGGLNQLIAMAYGTIPIVSGVGGLMDTVTDIRDDASGGTGFMLAECTAEDLAQTVAHAVSWLTRSPEEVEAARARCMASDWSWASTAAAFAQLYSDLVTAPLHRPHGTQSRQR
ncbi:glycogen synthase [Catellatospora methionotrophica]|uniref:glycogen synthase n=1 Tax=Catellatospora methionotrophica TaxID=121620 RepID=UPI00340EB031